MKKRILIILTLVLPVLNLFAQVPPPPDYGEDAGGPGVPSTPVDQYILVLVAFALLFAGYLILNQKKLIKN